jgi:predicted nuclease of predicted toxin-antitoxin system
VKFLIDECLLPDYVRCLADRGYPDSFHPRDVGLRSANDRMIVDRALRDDRIIITANRTDYLKLLHQEFIHPGAILVEPLTKEATWVQVERALAFAAMQTSLADFILTPVIEVSAVGGLHVRMAGFTVIRGHRGPRIRSHRHFAATLPRRKSPRASVIRR